jgi:Zn-dependent protease with chaperone function
MMRALVLAVIAILLLWPVRVGLLRARWTELAPRAAIVLWQSVGLALGVALLGACFELGSASSTGVGPRRFVTDFTASQPRLPASTGMRPSELFGMTAGLIVVTLLLGSLVVRAVGIARARARQRVLIDLVGTECEELPGTVIVDYPRSTAFGLPGFRGRVVVSSAAIKTLTPDELQAVLAHERAHLHAHHDLVLFPFLSLASSLPDSRSIAAVSSRVGTLVEMAADNRALRESEPAALARALCVLADARVSSVRETASAAARMNQRIERAFGVKRRSKVFAFGSVCAAVGIVALPLAVLFAPLSGR